jgi:hypothetical protein
MKTKTILLFFSIALIAMTSCALQKSAAYADKNVNGCSIQNSQADLVNEKKNILFPLKKKTNAKHLICLKYFLS